MLFRRSSASKPSNRGLSRRSPDGRKKRGLFLEQFEARQLMAVVDDMDTTGYSATSGFSDGAYIGYNSFRHHAYGDSSGDKATWTFTGLAAGNYRVSTTWPAAGSNSPAAPFTIRSGGTVVGAATVDQRIAPNDAQISGTWWEDLGTGIYSISGGDLTIEVSDQTTGYVMADAVRVDPWTGPEAHVTTGSAKVDDNSGTVDFGTAASWWNVEKSFTVRNAGVDSPLTLGTLSVPTGFTLVSGLGSQTLQPGETTSFTVRLDTSSPGAKSGQVSLVTNDGNENPFNFTVNGTVNNFQVIDDQDATGFTYSSGFGSGAYIGYNSYRHHANGDNTGDKATWTFNNIPAGTYRISGTWTSAPSNTAAAPFSVRSNGVVVGSTLVDQRQAANDAQAQGAWWEDLGTGIYTVAGGTLSVEVSDQTTGSVIADAIRIEPWTGPEVHVIATGGIKVDDNSGVIDYGTAANWWNVDKTFTVSNAGVGSALTLGSLSIPPGFTLVSGLGTQTLQPGESTSFIVRLDTSATGTKNGQISLVTNEGNENPFNFTVKGIVNNYQIVDDLDPATFSATSGFGNGAYLGYNTYFHYAYGDGSGDTATWTFNSLPAGSYRISATWPGLSFASTTAPFTIRAGVATIGTTAQNQQVAPNDFQSAGVWWEDLGAASYFVGNSPLTVEARDQTTNAVMADAIRIELLNGAPIAVNDQISVHGWNATTVAAPGVLANDSDREGASLTPTTVTAPQHGTLSWQAGGGFTYTPSRDGATSDSFQYRVSDGTTTSGVATVELTFTGLNSAPVASTIANRGADEDGAFDPIALRDFFADLEDSDDLLAYTATSPATDLLELTIDESTDNLFLDLLANAHGTAEVTVTATDTGGRSATTVFTVTVNSVNDAPSLANRLVTLDPANLLTGQQVGQLVVTDMDAETHTFVFTSGNENGGLTIDNTGRIFVADAEAFDFAVHGPYEYTLQVTDGAAAVTTAQLALAATGGFSVTGPATAGQNEIYTVELNGGVSFADWTITWGDGATLVVPGTATSASHVYNAPASHNISAEIAAPNVSVLATAPQTISVVQHEQVNLLINGGFEQYAVTHPSGWQLFPEIPGWTRSAGPSLELHRGLLGGPAGGVQHLELDADTDGPNGTNLPDERGSSAILQMVNVNAESTYELQFSFKARPDTASSESVLKIKLFDSATGEPLEDAILTASHTPENFTTQSASNGWTRYRLAFVPRGSQVILEFEDGGPDNTQGTLLDEVYVAYLAKPTVKRDGYFLGPNGCPADSADWAVINSLTVPAPGVLENDEFVGKTVKSIQVTTKPMFAAEPDAFVISATGAFTYEPKADWLRDAAYKDYKENGDSVDVTGKRYDTVRGDFFKYKIEFTDGTTSEEARVALNPPKWFRMGAAEDKVVDGDGGLALVGGGRDQKEIMQWIVERANGGDLVIINSTASGYMGAIVDDWKFLDPGFADRLNSVTELVVDKAALTMCPSILSALEKAEAIFIGGGDQGRDIRVWDGTSIETAISAAIADENRVVGGTSAGAMVLGARDYFGTDNLTSTEVLKDSTAAMVPNSEFSDVFLTPAETAATIVDTHLNRDSDMHVERRLGRMLGFLSILNHRMGVAARGISIDESTGLMIDEKTDNATVLGLGRVLIVKAPTVPESYKPLKARGFEVAEFKKNDQFAIADPFGDADATKYKIDVVDEVLTPMDF